VDFFSEPLIFNLIYIHTRIFLDLVTAAAMLSVFTSLKSTTITVTNLFYSWTKLIVLIGSYNLVQFFLNFPFSSVR